MNWETVGSIAEILGAIGVILSLLYVGKQLKQTNTMARSAVRQEIGSQSNEWAMSIASSPSLAEALSKVHFEGLVREDATGPERIRIAYGLVGLVGQICFAYEMWKEGILSTDELEDLYGPNIEILSKPYLPTVWSKLRPGYPDDFNVWFEQRFNLSDTEISNVSST